MTDGVTPHSLEAETALLGALLLKPELLDEAAQIVQPPDFFRPPHGTIFRHMLSLAHRRVSIDFVSLKESLVRGGELDAIGGPAYLASLTDGMPRTANVESYAKLVREKATLRELITASRELLESAKAHDADARELLDQAQESLYGIAVDRSAGGFIPMSGVISDEVMPLVETLVERKQAISGVPSGLLDLDYLTRGFQRSDLIIVAARPSMGKTSLVMNAGLHAATVGGAHVGVFSLEMSRLQLGLRAVIAESRIDGMRVQSGRIYDSEWAQWSQALGVVSEARLHIDDSAMVTVHDIRARARRLKAQVGLDLLIVDYIQLVKSVGRGENRNLELGEISSTLKAIAKDLNIPVIALSQLSRACEARADKRPMLSDLRDSGALEADADIVIFIYRDEVYNAQTPDVGIAELSIAKQRNGPIGTVKVGFQKSQTRFYNLHEQAMGATA